MRKQPRVNFNVFASTSPSNFLLIFESQKKSSWIPLKTDSNGELPDHVVKQKLGVVGELVAS